MPKRKALTERIANMALDVSAIAYECTCGCGHLMRGGLRKLAGKAEKLHRLRLVARAIEDRGELTDWQVRQIREAGISKTAERVGTPDGSVAAD